MKINISGMGCVCALGADTREITKNMYTASSAFVLPEGRVGSVYAKTHPVFQAPQKILDRKREDESFGFLFLRTAADEALLQAGLTREILQTARVGVIAGTTVNASFNCFDFYKAWRGGEQTAFAPLLQYLDTPLSGALQKYYGLTGAQLTVVTACASGTDAIGLGAQWIEQDICDVVLAGACDEINITPYTGFIRLMVASPKRCAPFSLGRAGMNIGEGAGVFVLESGKFLSARNGSAMGYILGYGTCVDAWHITAPDPEGKGLIRAMRFAMRDAGVTPADIAFINAHGTGTQDNDAAEARVFHALIAGVPVMASKSVTGHTLGAAGAVEAALCLLSLNVRMIPAAANFTGVDPALNLTPVIQNTAIEKEIAMSDSLAFGGCNSVIVIGSQRYSHG
ncbi:MAG: beta-ketoacyl-[acyl-carrier-protein] synthase family protein [Spirochaetota bacterium]|jgi:3-oxoacyl-[acyl-carrier-protein] synthase-1/3-oxoacyl-[acyl-carrier-protein] synthase II|nr:beta-ketoacyl-[acyl-carrier-protein] synthase family protein [Spirochaetota bacterium]